MRPVNRFPYKFIGTKMAQKWLEIVILWQKNVSNDLKNWHLVFLIDFKNFGNFHRKIGRFLVKKILFTLTIQTNFQRKIY